MFRAGHFWKHFGIASEIFYEEEINAELQMKIHGPGINEKRKKIYTSFLRATTEVRCSNKKFPTSEKKSIRWHVII